MNDVKQRKESMNTAVVQLEPDVFSNHLAAWLEATAYLRSRNEATTGSDPIAALGGAIPQFSAKDFDDEKLRSVADDAVFAFCIIAALKADGAAVDRLETALTERFGSNFPGVTALKCCRNGVATGEPLDDTLGGIIKDMLADKAFDPRDSWNAGLRLLEKSRKSNFGQEVMIALANWHRDRWKHIITQQLFNLTRPRVTVSPIENALGDSRNDQSFIASLLIAATGAVDLELDETYNAHLQSLARRD